MLRARLFALLALASVIGSASGESFDDWYQIEVIVFSQISPRANDETWAIREFSYPEEMVTIASPAPSHLAQLIDLQRYESLVAGDDTPAAKTRDEAFLFEDRSRFKARQQMEARLRDLERREQAAKAANAAAIAGSDNLDNSGDSDDMATENPEATVDAEAPAGMDIAALFESTRPDSFQPVTDNERFLTPVARSLLRSSRYRMLEHKAWRQPIAEGEAWPILVQTGDRYGDRFEVDGTLTVRRARFLHVDADLWFTRFAENEVAPVAALPEGIDPERAREFPELLSAARDQGRYIPIHTHRLGSSRRMRRSELHYLDHPYFGVIVQIERYTGPED